MFRTVRYVLGLALAAACLSALADSAEVKISNVSMSASQGQWWYWYPSGDTAAGVSAELISPSFANAVTGAPGTAMNVSLTDGSAVAQAVLGARGAGLWDLQGASASAKVDASGGQAGWAFTNVIDRSILVGGGNTTFTISAALDSIQASGPMTQANAYIEICANGSCDSYAEAFVDGTSGSYAGPSILSATWTSPAAGDAVWVNVRFGLTASVESLAPVPEPSTAALWLAGLGGIGVIARRRRH